MNNDPYQPPSAPVSASYASADAQISPLVLHHLLRTQPWVRLVSVIGLIMTVLMMGLMLYTLSLANAYARSTGMTTVVVVFIVLLVLAIYPLVRLSKYASAIARIRFSQGLTDLEDALDQQRAFWKFVGIMMLICTVLWLIGLMTGEMRPRYRGD